MQMNQWTLRLPLLLAPFLIGLTPATAQDVDQLKKQLLEEILKQVPGSSTREGKSGSLDGEVRRRDPSTIPRKKIPVPADIDTNARYNTGVLGPFYVRHLLKAYEAHTKDTGGAHEAGKTYLKETIRNIAKVQRAISPEARIKLGEAAVKAGAKDPLILAYLGMDYVNNPESLHNDTARKYLNQSRGPLNSSPYARFLVALHHRASAFVEMRNKGGKNKRGVDENIKRYASELEKSLSKNEFQDNEIQIYWTEVEIHAELLGADKLHSLHKAADAVAEPDPWLVCMLGGIAHHTSAWKARGSGYANTVTEEGWRGFKKHLGITRPLIERAWQLEPDYPHPATFMIRLTMAGNGNGTDDERVWFDRAVAGRLDHAPAYSSFLWAMRPRWHGSHAIMLGVGLDAADTQRYDTEVPMTLFQAYIDVRNETGQSNPMLNKPEVYAGLKKMFHGYIAHHKGRPEKQNFYRGRFAAVAYNRRQLDDAVEMFDAMGDAILDYRDGYSERRYNGMIQWAYVMTSPQKPEALDLLKLMAQGESKEAVTLTTTLLQNKKLHPRVRAFFEEQKANTKIAATIAQGGWANLATENLSGWQRRDGDWELQEPNDIKGSPDRFLSLELNANVGQNIEVKGNIEMHSQRSKAYTGSLFLGNTFVNFRLFRRKIEIGYEAEVMQTISIAALPTYSTRVLFYNNTISVYVNGHLAHPPIRMPEHPSHKHARISMGSPYIAEGEHLHYVNFHARKILDDENPHLQATLLLAPTAKEGLPRASRALESTRPAWEQILDLKGLDQDFRDGIRMNLAQADRMKQFDKGEWIDVEITPTWNGWVPHLGYWESDGKGVNGALEGEEFDNILLDEIYTSFELSVDLEFDKTAGDFQAGLGTSREPWKSLSTSGLVIDGTTSEISTVYKGKVKKTGKKLPVKDGKINFRVKLQNGNMYTYQDGEEVLILKGVSRRGYPLLLISGKTKKKVGARFSNLRIRKSPPTPPETK